MSFQGFTAADFDVFTVPGLDARMEQLIHRVRPKLETIGQQLAPALSTLCGEPMNAHVARHARRKVNPPADSWVAWSASKRGYKALPHFQVGLWSSHLFIQFAIIYECEQKATFARGLLRKLSDIRQSIPAHYIWSVDHTQPEGVPHQKMTIKSFKELAQNLREIKKAEALCGIHLQRTDPLLQDGEALLAHIEQTFQTVLPLFQLAQSR